ncbi:hypothetical protein QOT17_015886 [Balamuthia mandrillaris]
MASQVAETQTYGQRAPLTKPHTDDTKNRPPKGRSGRSGSDRAQSQVQPKTSRRVTTTTSRDRGKTQNTKGMKEALWLRDEGLDSMQVVQRLHQRGRKTVQLVSISPLGRKPLLAARKSWTPVEAGALKILQGHNHIAKLIEPCGITVDSWGIGVMAFFWLTQGGLFGNANRGLKAWKERDPQLLLDIAINKENLSYVFIPLHFTLVLANCTITANGWFGNAKQR